MSFINYMSREINCKIVYYGPGLSGKTTNMQYVYSRVPPENRGRMISLATETERALFFDFLPKTLLVRGFQVRLHLYTVPGPVFYDISRQTVLKGCDGVVFVADSQEARREANVEWLEDLTRNLEGHGMNIEQIPLIFQYNKRDLPQVVPLDDLENDLNPRKLPSFAAVASRGDGVFDTIKACAQQVTRVLTGPSPPAR